VAHNSESIRSIVPLIVVVPFNFPELGMERAKTAADSVY
jgi:hypothetical protein